MSLLAAPLWPQLWQLCEARNVEAGAGGDGGGLSDGTGVWWAARETQPAVDGDASGGDGGEAGGGVDAFLAGLQAMPPSGLADEALAEWLKFFAGHKGRDAD